MECRKTPVSDFVLVLQFRIKCQSSSNCIVDLTFLVQPEKTTPETKRLTRPGRRRPNSVEQNPTSEERVDDDLLRLKIERNQPAVSSAIEKLSVGLCRQSVRVYSPPRRQLRIYATRPSVVGVPMCRRRTATARNLPISGFYAHTHRAQIRLPA